jgi:hypothetical protein
MSYLYGGSVELFVKQRAINDQISAKNSGGSGDVNGAVTFSKVYER